MSSLRFSSVSPSLVQPPKEGQFALFLNSDDEDKAYVKDHLDNIKLFNNGDVNFTDITLESVLPYILGDIINFVHTDYGSETDIIEIGQTEITRGISQGIFNSALEGAYSGASPSGTEWNSVYTDFTNNGFGDLSTTKIRTYDTFINALNGSIGVNILSTPLIMHDLSTDKYYTFTFSSWTQGGNGGGFAYSRQEITISDKNKLTFSDETYQDTAALMDIESSSLEIGVVESVVEGKRIKTLSFAGGSGNVNYSNVLFVDGIQGNNFTALAGRFDKPFASIGAASSVANSMFPNTSNKVLIYVRRGNYYFDGYLIDGVDYYCESGVVLTGGRISDQALGVAVTSNFYGNAVLLNTDFYIKYGSTVNIEFDYQSNSGSGFLLIPISGTANITVKANHSYCSTFGTGYGTTIRNSVNLTMNFTRAIESVHSVVDFRNHSGIVQIDSPKIYLGSGNIYGGNFKQAIIVYGASATSYIKINADLESKDLISQPIGSNTGMCVMWGGTAGTFELNGNIIAGNILAIHSNNVANGGTVSINGNTSSSFTYGVWSYGGAYNFILGGKKHILTNILGLAVVSINGSSINFLNNASFYNAGVDGNILDINGALAKLIVHNCVGVSDGTLGYCVKAGAIGTAYIHSSRFNKPLDPSLIDQYVPTGLIVDVLTQVPKF